MPFWLAMLNSKFKIILQLKVILLLPTNITFNESVLRVQLMSIGSLCDCTFKGGLSPWRHVKHIVIRPNVLIEDKAEKRKCRGRGTGLCNLLQHDP